MELRITQFRKVRSDANLALSALLLLSGSITLAQQAAPASANQPNTVQRMESAAVRPVNFGSDQSNDAGGMTEEELKRMLVSKPMLLRGGYLSDSLKFNLHGQLIGESAPAPFTLCGVEIDRVRLTRHKVILVGARYGLHFLGALAYEDSPNAVDRVKITPKKKSLKITIERELVVKPKKKKAKEVETEHSKSAAGIEPASAENATAVQEKQPVDSRDAKTTTSPAHSAMVLKEALDAVFANSIDKRMIAAMPDFWKLYYQAAAAKTDYRPADPAVMRQNMVDQKARLITKFEPASNQFAQDHSVAGMALYHVVIEANGKPGEIAVTRPIGFGLDENAVAAIRRAKFEPAIKDGKPVPVLLVLVVQFRIYSNRTAVVRPASASDNSAEPVLPGPYSNQAP